MPPASRSTSISASSSPTGPSSPSRIAADPRSRPRARIGGTGRDRGRDSRLRRDRRRLRRPREHLPAAHPRRTRQRLPGPGDDLRLDQVLLHRRRRSSTCSSASPMWVLRRAPAPSRLLATAAAALPFCRVAASSSWPSLAYEDWSRHLRHPACPHPGPRQARGDPRPAPQPQLLHAALRLTARGWETLPLPAPDGSGAFVVAIDLHYPPRRSSSTATAARRRSPSPRIARSAR